MAIWNGEVLERRFSSLNYSVCTAAAKRTVGLQWKIGRRQIVNVCQLLTLVSSEDSDSISKVRELVRPRAGDCKHSKTPKRRNETRFELHK